MLPLLQKKPRTTLPVRKRYVRKSTRYPCNNFSVSFLFNGLRITGLGYDVSDQGVSFSVPTEDIVLLRGQEINIAFFTSTPKGEYSEQFVLKIASKRQNSSGHIIYGCSIPNARDVFDFKRFSCVNSFSSISCNDQTYQVCQQQSEAHNNTILASTVSSHSLSTIEINANNTNHAETTLTNISTILKALEEDLTIKSLIQDDDTSSLIKSTLDYIKSLTNK